MSDTLEKRVNRITAETHVKNFCDLIGALVEAELQLRRFPYAAANVEAREFAIQQLRQSLTELLISVGAIE